MSDPANEIPPGWDYNPATWRQRLPIVGLALAGLGIAMYLSLYQWEVIDRIWEPFFSEGGFGGGSREVLRESGVSQETMRYLGVPDGFLGALAYLVDALAGVIGSRRRWRTMPWIVVVFGVAVGPLGFVSVLLTVFQPVLYGSFCTLCLVTAAISVAMIGPAMDEMLASLQYLQRVRRSGHGFWRAFWGLETPRV